MKTKKHLSDVHKEKHALQGKTLDEILILYKKKIQIWDFAREREGDAGAN